MVLFSRWLQGPGKKRHDVIAVVSPGGQIDLVESFAVCHIGQVNN